MKHLLAEERQEFRNIVKMAPIYLETLKNHLFLHPSEHGLMGKKLAVTQQFFATGDPRSKQQHEAKIFLKEIKKHITCVWPRSILYKTTRLRNYAQARTR
jgi:hypothetical protein